MKKLHFNLSPSYPIYIGHNLLQSELLAKTCTQLQNRIAIITDLNLLNLYGTKLQKTLAEHDLKTELMTFPAGEINKTRETKQKLEDELLQKKFGRDTCLIALGGGVVTDMVGFLAATFCRGVPVIYIPTTLLAMVDASIGGKTGVNTPYGKNLIGAFAQPQAVFMDTQTLATLPEKEWSNGMTEMIKHSVIADAAIFNLLQKNPEKMRQHTQDFLIEMIYASCFIKKNIVEQDKNEQGLRKLLNFGHTIGHAIETLEEYRISHGEAVAIGMLVESYLSVLHGFLSANVLEILQKILQTYGLPLQTIAFRDKSALQQMLMLDKKAVKNVAHFVLLDNIGKPHMQNDAYTMAVDLILLNQALDWAKKEFDKV